MIDRAKVTDALPEGTLQVGVGLVIAGVTTYAYLTFAKAALGSAAYGPPGVLWAPPIRKRSCRLVCAPRSSRTRKSRLAATAERPCAAQALARRRGTV